MSSPSPEALAAEILQRLELFRDEERRSVARVKTGSLAGVAFLVHSQGFTDYLHSRITRAITDGYNPSLADAVRDIVDGRARAKGKHRSIHQRVARTKAGYDILLKPGRIVRVSAGGWKPLNKPRRLFVVGASVQDLPEPARDSKGKLQQFLSLCRLSDEDGLLCITWMLEALRPDTPYVGLMLTGAAGSAKSSCQRMLRSLVDPNAGSLRVAPRSEKDVIVGARHSHVLSFENMSTLSVGFQDLFCSVLTGASASRRRLYTDDAENLNTFKRPVVMNGIETVITRPDLLDRFLIIELPLITPADRKTEADVNAEFEKLKGGAFGELLDLYVAALALLPSIKQETLELPRMADFAQFGEAIARSMKHPPGHFLKVFARNRRSGARDAIDGDALGVAIVKLVAAGPLEGVAADLLPRLREASRTEGHSRPLPSTGKEFGGAVRRLRPALLALGVQVDEKRGKKGFVWRFSQGK